ncbi:MAG: sulfatase-like hydrolase/transferase [Anaerolineae bacterium]|jgi:arylsulfatase|nr:sulfatase-like hydrolase/transferase [Anaerolineae bacterium]
MAHSPNLHLRAHLPIPEVPRFGLTTYDAKDPDTRYAPIEPLRPPEGAPNVLIVLLDDVGFGASSAFGGPCQTPTFEKLAANGLRYNRFHTCALCAPTRQALMTGRNHHSVGMGNITETATAAPGQNSVRPNTKAPVAMTLKLNGYSTAMFGKCHEVPVWENNPMGPFEHWPSGGGGFEYFYGFIGGENNQWDPALFEGTTPVEPPATPEEGYHLTEDLADHAVSWIHTQKALMPDKPFFIYFSPGATHAPHHVPKEWADKYKGKFAQGWDKLREETLARQKALGVVPADCELTARHAEIPAWDDMPSEWKPILEREMEVYAGFMEHTDYHTGRVIAAIEDLGILEDTLIYVIIGDNGASAEGTLHGAFNEMANFNGMAALETPEFMQSVMDKFGSPESYNHYAVGWAHAMDTPLQWTKQVASHWGGTRNGTIVHWPKGIQEKGGLREQFSHVIDVAPTILEAAGLPEPVSVNGVQQSPMEGASMLYSFNAPAEPERHDLQYFEMFGNRGIYYKGWSAVTKHRIPWQMVGQKMLPFDEDIWELYDGSKDWSQAHDLLKEDPSDENLKMLLKLQRLWLIEATKYNAIPLDDRQVERILPELAGRPTLIRGKTQMFFPGMGRLSELSVLNIKNKSFSVTAEIEVGGKPANGVIVAQGGRFGGWTVYFDQGCLSFVYNVLGIKHFSVEATTPITAGQHQVRMEFAYDGGGLGKGGAVTLFYDGKPVAEGRVGATQAMIFSADETLDIGYEAGTPVSPSYTTHTSKFNGKIHWVQLDAGVDDHDHFIDPEERWRIAMARQ